MSFLLQKGAKVCLPIPLYYIPRAKHENVGSELAMLRIVPCKTSLFQKSGYELEPPVTVT